MTRLFAKSRIHWHWTIAIDIAAKVTLISRSSRDGKIDNKELVESLKLLGIHVDGAQASLAESTLFLKPQVAEMFADPDCFWSALLWIVMKTAVCVLTCLHTGVQADALVKELDTDQNGYHPHGCSIAHGDFALLNLYCSGICTADTDWNTLQVPGEARVRATSTAVAGR